LRILSVAATIGYPIILGIIQFNKARSIDEKLPKFSPEASKHNFTCNLIEERKSKILNYEKITRKTEKNNK